MKIKLLSILVLSALSTGAMATAPVIYSFEDGVPSWVTSDGEVSSSTKRSINGDHSLFWKFNAGDTLTLTQNIDRINDTSSEVQVITFWMYNENPIKEPIWLVITDATGMTRSTEKIGINFTGWRNVTLSLGKDMSMTFNKDIAKIEFQAPTSTSGALYIDRLMFAMDDDRYQWSDDQVTTRFPVEEIDYELEYPLPSVSSHEIQKAQEIRTRLVNSIVTGSPDIASLEKSFKQFEITKTGDNISGKHLITDKQLRPYNFGFTDKETERPLICEYAVLGESSDQTCLTKGYAKLMLDLAKAYNDENNQGDKDRIAEMYILMSEHMFDQGFVDGSALGTTHHWGYSGRWWYLSALLMEIPLRDSNLLETTYDALTWFSREFRDRGFEMKVTNSSTDMDYFNTLAQQQLSLILLNPDDKERIALLKKFSKFLSDTIDRPIPAYNDGFRPDGTAWRHKGNYPGYSFPAFESVGSLAYIMRGDFGISKPALDIVKKSMITGWISSNPYVPLGLAGRHPFDTLTYKRYSNGLKNLALSYENVDEELAAIYLQMSGKTEADSVTIFGKSIKPAALPEGSWSFNGGAYSIHRYDDRMAVFKGYNQDVWASEIYTADNRFGRYQSHGSVHVIPFGGVGDRPDRMGFQQEGWDWNRNPNTTTIWLPLSLLESPSDSTVMMLSKEGYAGSTSLENKHTLFGMKHKDSDRTNYEPTFVWNKYVMATDKFIYLTGNNISNDETRYNTETTLFQIGIQDGKGVVINGKQYSTMTESPIELKSGDWIIDDNGVGYYLVDVDNTYFKRERQTSKDDKTEKPTYGDFSVAWINHGQAPEKANYEYIMVMDTNPSEMSAIAKEMKALPRFETLKSNEYHAVLHDKHENIYGYTAFDETEIESGYLTHIDKPAQILTRVDAKKSEMYISASSLSLNFEKIVQDNGNLLPHPNNAWVPQDISFTVKGLWDLTSGDAEARHEGEDTVVKITSEFGMSKEVTLSSDEIPMTPLEPAKPVVPEAPNSDGKSGGSTTPLMLLSLMSLGLLRKRK